ncbi:hypothetical protein H5410_034891 [Solanum commersonii]|uniref:Uncharacterized protein n=1 Tax=Solanum commersonii TaxID=4109 RepID=A0A9J5XZ75_SOLCO|nr:hypothetical protein H5410_034891 [Solanum commersonii]
MDEALEGDHMILRVDDLLRHAGMTGFQKFQCSRYKSEPPASLSHATGTFTAAAWFLSLFPINRSDLSLKFASSPGHLFGSDDIVLGKQKLQVEHSLERKKNEASEKLGLSERVVAPLCYASDFSVNGP